ncbi:hypothetical protein CRG98_014963 [Punica granatum]|uniref:Uncharacterized protein n=1 Tax=Punica granatum TaxID=22663 RepID=A0A2I0K7W8_PUNGR|nr:hypothetical protein CRG98_014963 [Punica granatum]
MARLSTPTRSPIGSPTELNHPRQILLQAQRATKHAIQTIQDSQHQPKDGREGRATSKRPSSKAGFRQIKHTATPGAKHRRSNFIVAATPIYSRSTLLGQHQPYAHGTPRGIFSLTDSYLPHATGRAIDTSETVKGCSMLPNHRCPKKGK